MGEREGSPFPQIPAHLRQLLALPWVFQHRNQRRWGLILWLRSST